MPYVLFRTSYFVLPQSLASYDLKERYIFIMSDDSVSLVIIVACLVCSSYFSATETAFSTMNHARMKTMADKGNKSATLALKLSDN